MLSSLFRGRKLAPAATEPVAASSAFRKLGLTESVARGAEIAGYTEPTPIQLQAIPLVLKGRDVIGSAQTGTGKTAAFALPILSLIEPGKPSLRNRPRVLILEPTRELALQVAANFKDYSRFTELRTGVVYGGVGYGKQRQELEGGADVLAATPGRLIDLLEQRMADLRDVEILVLDEVDRMLDMGFLPAVKQIVQKCPAQRQTLFFSATLPPEITALTKWALRDPQIIEIGQRQSPAETVTHAFYPVASSQKFDLLVALLDEAGGGSTLIFTRTKHGADRIARRLQGTGRSPAVLHSNRSQSQRVRALEGFRDGTYPIMVATDIAARGIDVAGVTHVINFDVPKHPEDYVHRIGRTGRARQVGDAFTLLSGSDDSDAARAIERFIGATVPRKEVKGFTYAVGAVEDTVPRPQQQRGGGQQQQRRRQPRRGR